MAAPPMIRFSSVGILFQALKSFRLDSPIPIPVSFSRIRQALKPVCPFHITTLSIVDTCDASKGVEVILVTHKLTSLKSTVIHSKRFRMCPSILKRRCQCHQRFGGRPASSLSYWCEEVARLVEDRRPGQTLPRLR